MTHRGPHHSRGSAVVALMLIAVIILGAMLAVHTAAVITVGNTSRAFELARENAAIAVRLERTSREAVQVTYGTNGATRAGNLETQLNALLAAAPFGAVGLAPPTVDHLPTIPLSFPNLVSPAAGLTGLSSDFNAFSTPELLAYVGPRNAESDTFTVRYSFARQALGSAPSYGLEVNCRLIAVPLSRFGIAAYDLPEEIGHTTAPLAWPTGVSPGVVAPRGLVPTRDPATVHGLDTAQKRPAHYRYSAALSEAYQYVFSGSYLQNAADCAGLTHFVQIGAGGANPTLDGGSEVANTYSLDIGAFGRGVLGSFAQTKNLAVFTTAADGALLRLSDSGANSTPILLVIAGPANASLSPLRVVVQGPLVRPVVLVCYRALLEPAAGAALNGAVFLDRDCSVLAGATPWQVGHVSYWAGGPIASESFRLGTLPPSAEALAPRVIYAATWKRFL